MVLLRYVVVLFVSLVLCEGVQALSEIAEGLCGVPFFIYDNLN